VPLPYWCPNGRRSRVRRPVADRLRSSGAAIRRLEEEEGEGEAAAVVADDLLRGIDRRRVGAREANPVPRLADDATPVPVLRANARMK